MSKACVMRLGVPILPNGQLTQLAIPKYRDRSIGEVDFTVTECTTGTAQLRMRALILADLSCECYGGQTFHLDNDVVADIKKSTVSLHNGTFVIQLPHHNRTPMPPATIYKPTECSTSAVSFPTDVVTTQAPINASQPPTSPSGEPILMKSARFLLPEGSYTIPLQRAAAAESVLILPPTPKPNPMCQPIWEPQVCQVASGAAVYFNHAKEPLAHPKNTQIHASKASQS